MLNTAAVFACDRFCSKLLLLMALLLVLPGCKGCGEEEAPRSKVPPVEIPKPRDLDKTDRTTDSDDKPSDEQTSPNEAGRKQTDRLGEGSSSHEGLETSTREPAGSSKDGDTPRSERQSLPGGPGGTESEESRGAGGSPQKGLDEARKLKKFAENDEKAGRISDAYRKLLEAWNLARRHADQPGSAGLAGTLQLELSRLKTKLNSGQTPTHDKPIRVR